MADNNGRKSGNSSVPPPVKACNHCHNSHVACDGERPCGRCVKRGVADHCRDLVPRKKGRPARTDPRFRPKYPNPTTTISNHGTTKSQDNNSNSDDNVNIDNINPRTQGRSPTTPGTGASDTETASPGPNGPSFRHELHHHTHNRHTDDLPYSDGDNDEDEDDNYEDAAAEEERWQRQQCRDERPKTTAESPPDLASRMIAMMADEVHKLRKENAKLRCKVKKLRKHKRAREHPNHTHTHDNHNYTRGLHDGMSACPAGPKRPRYDHGPIPPPPPAETWLSGVAGECAGLREARKHMPFLNQYRMSADVPLVVGDIQSLPVFALESPPVVGGQATWVFFNESFSSMLQFTREELRRVPLGAVLADNPKLLESLFPLFQDQKPWSVSDILTLCSLMRRRDGRTVRSTSNMQFFYGPTGIVKYVIIVTLHWEEDVMREGERFKEKLNVATTTTTAGPLSVPLSTPHLDAEHPPTGAYGSSYTSVHGEDPATPAAGGSDNAHYWDQVLQSLAAPGVIHPAPSFHYP